MLSASATVCGVVLVGPHPTAVAEVLLDATHEEVEFDRAEPWPFLQCFCRFWIVGGYIH